MRNKIKHHIKTYYDIQSDKDFILFIEVISGIIAVLVLATILIPHLF